MAFTERETLILEKVKLMMPSDFIASASDEKILGFVDMVVNDANWFPPLTNYTRETFPDSWLMTIVLGCAYFAQLFKQMEATLQDFNYNDNGLSVQVDQVGKLNTALERILKAYGQQVEFMKKSMIAQMGAGLGTPRFQSQIGQFIKIALGSSFSWNSNGK
jgi:hypothetical protein